MAIQNVTLLGADGKLGPAILDALLAHKFTVTVLKRTSSKSPDTYPSGVSVRRVDDSFTVSELVPQLQGQDALIATIKGNQTDIQHRLAVACVEAGVQRFIPADFGSVDSSSAWTQSVVPLYKRKTELREKLMELASQNPNFSWTALVCGHFFDWSLEFLHVYLSARRAEILDAGDVKWSASTLSQIGTATARILQKPEETSNKIVYVQSFRVTQMEVIKAFEKATGQNWEVVKYDSKEYQAEESKKADAGDLEAVENLVWLLGALDADWTKKENFAMEMLGLREEDLDQVVSRVVKEQDGK